MASKALDTPSLHTEPPKPIDSPAINLSKVTVFVEPPITSTLAPLSPPSKVIALSKGKIQVNQEDSATKNL